MMSVVHIQQTQNAPPFINSGALYSFTELTEF